MYMFTRNRVLKFALLMFFERKKNFSFQEDANLYILLNTTQNAFILQLIIMTLTHYPEIYVSDVFALPVRSVRTTFLRS